MHSSIHFPSSDFRQNGLDIHESVSVPLIFLVCFLDSVDITLNIDRYDVDRYVFIAILLFIVLIFFSLNKSL